MHQTSSYRLFARFLVSVLCILFVSCSSSSDKIGSTVKGTRIAVIENTRTIRADPDLEGFKPDLPDIILNKDWAQPGYDASHVMPNVKLSVHPQKLWTVDIGQGSNSDFRLLARPVIADGLVFTMDAEGLVSAFDVRSGDLRWEFDTTPPESNEKAIGGGIAIMDKAVYATTGFGEVLSLSIDTGKPLWRRRLSNPLRAAPTLTKEHVFVVTIDNQLQALDIQSGETLWHHNGIAENATLMGASSPAVVGDSVVVAYSSGEIYNLRSENGRVSWNYSLTTPTQVGALPAIADIRGLPVIAHGQILAVSHSGRMASIDQRTGDRSWENDIGGITTPLVAGNVVFVLNTNDQLICVELGSGRIIWVREMQHRVDPADQDSEPVYWSGPALAENLVWMTSSSGELVSIAPADGAIIDAIDIGGPSYIPPVIANGVMYIITDNGKLLAYH